MDYDKRISAYALIAHKCVAMAQFFEGDSVSHCALVWETAR